MNKLFLALVAMLVLVACNKTDNYIIEGALYGGGHFEGEMIYLVPFENGNTSRIDSAIVHEGRFRFEGKVDKEEMCILRMRPMMRLFVKELLVVKEPGHVRTTLSKVSTAHGTPQNDSLENWRIYKAGLDSILLNITKQTKRANEQQLADLERQRDSIKMVFDKHNQAIVSRNNNVFGDFINKYAQ